MNIVSKLTLTFCAMVFANSVYADMLPVEYKGFYSHLRKLKGDELNALQFAFGFKNVQSDKLCNINRAVIITDKKDIPVSVSPANRFTLPTERALRLADAIVLIDLQEAHNQCDMSVQLETKAEYLKMQYQQEELQMLFMQFDSFFDEMGSFLWFLMPDLESINLVFETTETTVILDDTLSIKNGILSLSQSQIEQLSTLTLPMKPIRISPVAR